MPNNWKTYSVEELINEEIIYKPLDGNHGGTHPKGSDFIKSGIPFIMATDIVNGKVDIRKCKFISKEQADKLRKGFAKTGDILITHKASIGRTAVVPEIESEYIMLTPQVTYYRVRDRKKLDINYLKQYFNSPFFQNEINRRAGSGSTRAYIGITDQLKLTVSFPSIEEQQSIASILSTIDNKIDNNLAINKTLEEMAMALYKNWFVDFGPFQDGEFIESELGMIPKDWEVKSLENIGDFKNGKGINASKRSDDGKYIILGSNGIIGRTNEIMFKKPVIAIGRVGANYGEIHYSIEPCWISDNAITVQPQLNNHYWFIYQILKEVDYSNFATGSAQPLITQSSVKALKFSCPDLESLDLYSSKIEMLYNKRNENLTENQSLTQLRDTLLPQLISGAVRLKEFRETVEEVV